LEFDQSALVRPTREPIGRAEQKVIDEYSPLVKEAEAEVDTALAAFTEAQQAHMKVLEKCAHAGVVGDSSMPVLMLVYSGPMYARVRLSEGEKAKLRGEEQRLRDILNEAEHTLSRARGRLIKLEQRRDAARRSARDSE
jgi:hypothetical protein